MNSLERENIIKELFITASDSAEDRSIAVLVIPLVNHLFELLEAIAHNTEELKVMKWHERS